ncbi:MAG TPA: small multi-drug export protein [Spirochaetota bacterium]|nr:small multi-drug export protein [Spirochaetota bacterium]HOL57718.1 small multi-drug export protein [Spirochaetota bacterium]HPP04511.1 small multi-drug export protein [Spirochaetota bacterium]
MKKLLLNFLFIFIVITFLFSIESHEKKDIGIKITEFFLDKGINPYFIILIISMLPIVELRGSIPIGILFLKLQWIPVIIISIIGNMLPIFFILLFFGFVEKILRKISIFDKFFNWLFKKTISKSKSIEKYKELGLMFFIGIPLPVTGAWTGSLIAYLLKLSYIKSIIFIFLGVLAAAFIVSAITYFKLIGLIVALAIFIVITISGMIFKKREDKNQ